MNIFFKGTFFQGTQLKQSNFTLNQVILLFFLLIGQRIPAKFARTYIKEKQCKASLRVSDGQGLCGPCGASWCLSKLFMNV